MLSLDQSTSSISCYSDHTYSIELKNSSIPQYVKWITQYNNTSTVYMRFVNGRLLNLINVRWCPWII